MIAKRKSPVEMEADEVTPDNENPAEDNAELGPTKPAARAAQPGHRGGKAMHGKKKRRKMHASEKAKSFGGWYGPDRG